MRYGKSKAKKQLSISTLTVNESSLVVPCVLHSNGITIKTHAFVDSGATGESFIDTNFVRANNLTTFPLPQPRRLRVVDGTDSSAGNVTHFVVHNIQFEDHTEEVRSFVTKLDKNDILLGFPWLSKHNPYIDWEKKSICFRKKYCKKNCLTPGTHQHIAYGLPAPSFGPLTIQQ